MENIKSTLRKFHLFRLRIFQYKRARQLKDATSSLTPGNGRYEVCKLLAHRRVSNVIWLEDLLALHGSDTQVWDLHLLVDDPRMAANILLKSGYEETPPEPQFEKDPEFSKRAIRITRLQPSTGVVLHFAREWYYQLDDNVQGFLPPLHSFLDSMIEFWLNISSRDYVDRLGFALYIGCLINYCYYLQSPEGEPVKSPTYAEKLKLEHREVHYNIVATDPKEDSFTTTSRHIYHVGRSKEIKEGTFMPKPYENGVFTALLATVPEI